MARRSLQPLLGGLFWGAALFVGAGAPATAQQATTETAMSVPRTASPGGVPGLPQVLAPSEAARLRRIFDLQSRGEFAAAQQEAARLHDHRLLGHVLADWLLRQGEAAPVAELQAWLGAHADHPQAQQVHALLGQRLPRGESLPPPPPDAEALDPAANLAPEEREPATQNLPRNAALERSLRDRAREGNVDAALAMIERSRATPAYAARLRAEMAQELLQQGRDEQALRLAQQAARHAGSGRAGFTAGLAAWGLGHWDQALQLFERAARDEATPPSLRAAAAFWTARAAVRARRPQHYVPWMLQAAQEPRTFYGLVARRALGLPNSFAWDAEVGGEAEAQLVAETANGWRALGLLQIGQRDRAEAELRLLWGRARSNPGLSRAMLSVASQASLTGLAAQLAAATQGQDGRPRDFARFPLPQLRPQQGFRVDPALLYALALTESRFDAAAVSPAGARGLLQLMPNTASYIANDPSLRGENAHRLNDASYSLELGQRYLHMLARHDAVDSDLIRVLAAYNAGVGNLQKWLPASGHRDDPFLFIEAIPVNETRQFVQQVLAFSWIYASRLGLPAASLDQLAAGSFPRFAQPDEVVAALRVNTRRTVH